MPALNYREEEVEEKPYFKVNVNKLVKKLGQLTKQDLNFNESQRAMLQGLNDHRFWVHISARRTGKSFAAAIIGLAKLLEPNQFVTIVAPNYNLSTIIWDYMVNFIKVLLDKNDIAKHNEKERVVKLKNGSVLRLLSANNRDSLIGRGANLLIVDEAAVIPDDEYYQRDLRPAMSTYSDSRVLFISTPRGQGNYLYEYFLRGENPEIDEWGSALYTWRSNPLLGEKDVMEAKKTLAPAVYEQEYECSWVTFEGLIFELIKERHIKKLDLEKFKNSTKYDFIGGLDLGYKDTTVFLVIATDGEDNYFVVEEYSATGSVTSVDAEHIQELIDKWDIDYIYIDSANQQTKADLAYDFDIYCENANKSVLDGILFLQNLFDQNMIIFDETFDPDGGEFQCYRQLLSYKWKDKVENPKPEHKEPSHYADALRYAIYTHHTSSVGIYS